MSYKYATIDIESTGLDRYTDDITYIGVGLSKDIDSPIYKYFIYRFSHPDEVEKFKRMCAKLRAKKIRLVWQNGKFDTLFIEKKLGIKLPMHEDTMLLGNAYDMAAPHGLKVMAQAYLGVPDWDIKKKDKTSQNDEEVIPYLKKDVKYTWELFRFFYKNLTKQQWKIYKKLLRPAYKTYRIAERNGIYIDRDGLKKVTEKYVSEHDKRLAALNSRYDINWNSPSQVAEVLYEKEGMPVVKLSPSKKPSCDAEALKKLKARGFKLAEEILDYKFYNGAITKFLYSWAEASSHDGRIHPNFNITDVRTGRTSCSNPNLQQVPRNMDLRTLFRGKEKEGREFIEADYSQIELRGAAHYSNDPVMIDAYRNGKDLHMITAMGLTGKEEKDVTKEERSKAKPVNFGFLYGMMAKGFVDYAWNNYGTTFTLEEAEYYRDRFFQTYPNLLGWHEEQIAKCIRDGGVYDLFGRFRKLPDIYSKNFMKRSTAERCSINTPVQGSCSSILLGAMIDVHEQLHKELDVRVVGSVHDSMLLDFPKKYEKEVVSEVARIMKHPTILDDFEIELRVPILGDVGVGPWGIGH